MTSAFEIDSTLTYANATAVFQTGLKYIAACAINKNNLNNDPHDPNNGIDCSRLTNFDSSALAVLMGWRRTALANGISLKISHLPTKLLNLARTYGIDRLLCDQ